MTSPPSERRTLAVLFAGLCDVPALPALELRDFLDAAFVRLRRAVESRGGTVDKFVGDTLMAVFGAPAAHEDDALRAVRAALAMLEEPGAPRLRIGVNFGEVLWGQVAGAPVTAMGDVVNVARRLQEAAAAGEALVEASVERLTRRVIRYRALEPMRVKGRTEEVRAFAAEGLLGGETSIRHGAGRETPLVGRGAERGRLLSAWEQGRGAFVAVVGEAGVGKTRLVADFRIEVRRRGGARVATGRALEEARLPMAAFAEIARAEGAGPLVESLAASLAEAVPGAVERENLAHLMALSIGVAVPDARVRAIDPSRLVEETHHAWSVWAAARGPALLCVEDLQWADDATLALLESLARAAAGRPLMVVATARPGARLPAGFDRVDLADLPPDDALRLASGALGGPLSPALREFLAAQSGGNPLYLEELVRFLREEHLVEGSPLELLAPAGRIPAGLNGLLVARIDALQAATREALKTASVLGRAFWPGVLGELLGRDPAAEMREAARAELVAAQRDSLLPGEPQMLFRHALLRDAAYSLLPKKERARLHAAAADRLVARQAGRPARVLAAAHREHAGDAHEAARLWEEASLEALEAGAPAEALGHAREAARATRERPTAVLAAADALLALGRPGEAVAQLDRMGDPGSLGPELGARARHIRTRALDVAGRYREAADAAQLFASSAPEGRWKISAGIALASALIRLGKWEETLAELDRCRALFGASPELAASRLGHRLAASMFIAYSNVHAHRGDAASNLDACRRALEEAREGGDLASEAAALNNMGNALRTLSRAEDALACYRASLDIDRRTGNRAGIASGLNNVGNIHRTRGELDPAENSFREALQIRREIGDRAGTAACLGNLGNLEGMRGRPGPALAWYVEALQLAREAGDPNATAASLNNIGWARMELGELEAAQAACEESAAIRRKVGESRGLASALTNLSMIFRAMGEPGRALVAADESVAVVRTLADDARTAEVLLERGRTRRALQDEGGARADFSEALECARKAGAREVLREVTEALGPE